MIISVITITYNNPEELRRTLASVPVYDFVEQVVVNGGDSKETLQVLENLKGVIINEKDKGIADAFNKGTRASSGDALMYLNSGDTILNPAYLRNALEVLTEMKDVAFIHSNILFADDLGGELTVKPAHRNPGRGMKYLHPSMIIRREVFDAVEGFDTTYKIAMDFDFILKAEKLGYKGFYIDGEPVVKMEGGGKSQEKEFAAIKECIRSLKENKMMSAKNISGAGVRTSLFFFRKLMVISGGGKLLGKLKRIKYSGD
jgi:glycosyltransferase involved in cell wall biosynthesis